LGPKTAGTLLCSGLLFRTRCGRKGTTITLDFGCNV
jgi:hypothetical protein